MSSLTDQLPTYTLLASQGSVRLWACFHHIWTSHTAGTMVLSPSQPLAQSRVTSSPRWQLAETTASSINLFSDPSREEQREKIYVSGTKFRNSFPRLSSEIFNCSVLVATQSQLGSNTSREGATENSNVSGAVTLTSPHAASASVDWLLQL